MIRLIEDKDIDAVMEIWLQTNISAHDFIPEKYWIGNFHAVKGEYLPKSANYVYEENGAIKGFVSVIEECFIGALFVSKDFQQQGIGKQFIQYCQDKHQHLEVAVYEQNTKAIEFYKSCGFRPIKKQKNTDSGHPEIMMAWNRK